MSTLLELPLIISAGIGVGGFVFGWAIARALAYSSLRSARSETQDLHHQVRSLEASLRISQKKADESIEQLEQATTAMDELHTKLEAAEQLLYKRDVQLCDSQQAINDETSKVRALRIELSGRAEEKIRAEYTARELETELSIARAGSAVISDEVGRLAAEHENLSTRLEMFETGTFVAQSEEPDETIDALLSQSEDDFQPDC